MNHRARYLAAILCLVLVCPGCQFEDLDGDGFVSFEEIVTAAENWMCGESTDTADSEGNAPETSGTDSSGTTTPSGDDAASDETSTSSSPSTATTSRTDQLTGPLSPE